MTLINVTPGKEQSKVFRLQTKLIQSSTLVQALLKTVWLHDKVSKNLPLIHSVTLHGVLLLWQWTLLLQSSWALNSFQSRSAGAVVQNLPRPAHAICLKWLSALIRGSFKWTAHGSWVGVSLMVGRGGKRREWENKGRTEVSSSHDRELLAVFMSSLRKQKVSIFVGNLSHMQAMPSWSTADGRFSHADAPPQYITGKSTTAAAQRCAEHEHYKWDVTQDRMKAVFRGAQPPMLCLLEEVQWKGASRSSDPTCSLLLRGWRRHHSFASALFHLPWTTCTWMGRSKL